MRPVRLLALLLPLGGAWSCGDQEGAPSACELGPEIYQDALREARAGAPACRSDEDCVAVDTDVSCSGISISLCGDVMHREAAARWDAAAVCARIEEATMPGRHECSQQASCISYRPACVAGSCTAVDTNVSLATVPK